MKHQLMFRMAGVYSVILLIGTLIIVFNNKIIYGSSLAKQFKFVIKAILVGDVLIFALLMLFTIIRLNKALDSKANNHEHSNFQALQRLFRFPTELFWGMLIMSLFFSCLFHFVQWLVELDKKITQEIMVQLIHTLLAEQILALTLAVLLYSGSRKLLRPFIAKQRITHLEEMKHSSLVSPLLITFSSMLMLTLFNMYRYVVITTTAEQEVMLAKLVLIVGVYFCIGLILFLWHLLEMKEQINLTTADIGRLLNGQRVNMHSPMFVLSNDEIGQLKSIFNLLQHKIAQDYIELKKEMDLASDIQQKLLQTSQNLIAAGTFITNPLILDGSTQFYDIGSRQGQRYLLTVNISMKGLPAAIMMSAILVLFRTGIERVGSEEKMLSCIHSMITELVKEIGVDVSVDIGRVS